MIRELRWQARQWWRLIVALAVEARELWTVQCPRISEQARRHGPRS